MEELEAGLKELHLPTIRACYRAEAEKARQESWPPEGYLKTLVEQECEVRRQNRIERWLEESKLPRGKSLVNFELKRLPPAVAMQVKGLLSGDFLKDQENVLAFGNPGSGKTHLLCALGQELIYQGFRVFFSPCGLLIQELLAAKRDLRLHRLLKKLARYQALILDDLGYVQHSREEMEVLFALLSERYERGSVMISSNLPFSKWEKIFHDPMLAAAAIDRLVHHSIILELNLSSYRLEASKNMHKKKDS